MVKAVNTFAATRYPPLCSAFSLEPSLSNSIPIAPPSYSQAQRALKVGWYGITQPSDGFIIYQLHHECLVVKICIVLKYAPDKHITTYLSGNNSNEHVQLVCMTWNNAHSSVKILFTFQ